MFKPVSPQVDFPQMERDLLSKWYKDGTTKKYLHRNDSSEEKFSFLDGPITANNPMGFHHAWGRTYKDFWQRFWNMKGKKQRFQNGFDEQGLWVEVEVEKELKLHNKKDIENLVPGDRFKSIEKFINLCKERVKKFSQVQTEQSKRLGYFMDWDNSYHTSSPENNYAIWNFLKVVNEKGWLYKGHDTVPWCPRCGTAISQHEILTEEYKEITHEAVYFKLPIKNRKNEYLLVWTTTPWTIPSNVAVAVNSKEKYASYPIGDETVWIMEKASARLQKEGILPATLIRQSNSISGKDLVGLEYDAAFDSLPLVKEALEGYIHRIIDGGDVVTIEEGTGLLHVAPSAGEEDFRLGKENKLPVIPSIEEDASYVAEMGEFAGANAKKHPELIIDYLKSFENGKYFYTTQRITHRYPTCWRCKTELVWRLVDEWYIAMDRKDGSGKTYREQMVEVTKQITWMPAWGLERELDWLKNMHDWLISKKRYWGLALPIWYCENCKNFEVIGGVEQLKEKAVSGWEQFDGNSPHRPWIDSIKIKCEKCGELVSRIPDVGNPWLDAGIVPYSTMPDDWRPADFITESFPGQFKNWFYSLIAMSAALEGKPSFKRVLGFGSVKDEKGEEMHKSKGNSVEFNEAADKIGVDVMRWLYLKTNPEHNVNFGYHVADEIRRFFHIRLWNSYSFFVGYANNANWDCKIQAKELSTLDKWVLSRLTNVVLSVNKSLGDFDAMNALKEIEDFVVNDFSMWYVRRSRDRVGSVSQEDDRNASLSVMYGVLVTLSKLLAPFTPFIAEEIYRNLTGGESVHLEDYPKGDSGLIDIELEKQMDAARSIVETAHSIRKEKAIKVRQPLAEAIITSVNREESLTGELEDLIKSEVNVKKITWTTDTVGSNDKIATSSHIWYKVELDTQLTPELLNEGKARDIIRKIQGERKNLGTKLDDKVDVFIESWPEEFEEEIKKKALVNSLVTGEFKVTLTK